MDFWPLPWALYQPDSLDLLVLTSLALVLVPFSANRRVERHRLRVAPDLRVRHLP